MEFLKMEFLTEEDLLFYHLYLVLHYLDSGSLPSKQLFIAFSDDCCSGAFSK